jgi:hypothetical protein
MNSQSTPSGLPPLIGTLGEYVASLQLMLLGHPRPGPASPNLLLQQELSNLPALAQPSAVPNLHPTVPGVQCFSSFHSSSPQRDLSPGRLPSQHGSSIVSDNPGVSHSVPASSLPPLPRLATSMPLVVDPLESSPAEGLASTVTVSPSALLVDFWHEREDFASFFMSVGNSLPKTTTTCPSFGRSVACLSVGYYSVGLVSFRRYTSVTKQWSVLHEFLESEKPLLHSMSITDAVYFRVV